MTWHKSRMCILLVVVAQHVLPRLSEGSILRIGRTPGLTLPCLFFFFHHKNTQMEHLAKNLASLPLGVRIAILRKDLERSATALISSDHHQDIARTLRHNSMVDLYLDLVELLEDDHQDTDG